MGKWCPHCDTSRGCHIYLKRPKKCEEYQCEWLKGFGGDDTRPDCTKIILDFHTEGILPKLLQIWEANGGVLRKSFAKEMVRFALENGMIVVLIHISGKLEIITGNIKLPKEVVKKALEEGIRFANRT